MNTKIHKISDVGHLSGHLWEYELEFPEYLAKWDVWDYWEKARFDSLKKHINKDFILFDIGTEQGACSALISKYFTPKMVLIEPSKEFWPTIQSIWEMNNLVKPLGFWTGFASDCDKIITDENLIDWSIKGDVLNGGMPYKYLNNKDDTKKISTIKVDTLSGLLGIVPDGLNIDVEGSELLVLKGSKYLLTKYRPLVWVSIHPDLGIKHHNITPNMVIDFMESVNYKGELLAEDHEQHWFFTPKEKQDIL